MSELTQDQKWLLERIEQLWKRAESNLGWRPTHRNIWQGSYDVWFSEQDRLDAINIPKIRMQEATDSGLIYSESCEYNKFTQIVWKLTELGKEHLKNE